jgi:hypothetical protein
VPGSLSFCPGESQKARRFKEGKMKKHLKAWLIVLVISATAALLILPRPAEGTVSVVRLDPGDIREVLYKVNIKTVTVELQREINGVTKLAFVDYNKLEALQLIELLTSQRGLVASVDPDRGYVFDYGFVRKAE